MDVDSAMNYPCELLRKNIGDLTYLITCKLDQFHVSIAVLEMFNHINWIPWVGKHGSRHQNEVFV